MSNNKYILGAIVISIALVFSACATLWNPLVNQRNAVVLVSTPSSLATGFIINSRGCVLTAAHAVYDSVSQEIRVDRPGIIPYLPYHTDIISEKHDLAVICPNNTFSKPPLFVTFSHTKQDFGTVVFLHGWYEKERAFVDRRGLVLDEISFSFSKIQYIDLFRTLFTKPIMGGFSGSPVVSAKDGSVVGLLVMYTMGPIPPDGYLGESLNAEEITNFLHENHIEHTDGLQSE